MPRAARSSKTPPPAYVRVAGGLTVVVGTMIAIWLPYLGAPWLARAAGAGVVVGGVGLILGRRWAWPFLVLTAVPMFGVALVFFLPSGDTDPYDLVHPLGVPFLIVGCLLLVASVTRATRRWLTGVPIDTGPQQI